MSDSSPSVAASSPRTLFESPCSRSSHTGSQPSSDDATLRFDAYPNTNDLDPTRLQGWPLLAELMAATPAFEAFARFRSLNVKNLLYYQVELTKLESDLRDRERVDMKLTNGENMRIFSRPESMMNSQSPQWDIVKEIRTLLREYNEAILQYTQVSALAEPSSYSMRELVTWMRDTKYGDDKIRGMGAKVWGGYEPKERDLSVRRFWDVFKSLFQPKPPAPHMADLAAPRGRVSPDMLGRWISEEAIPLKWDIENRLWSKKKKEGDLEQRRNAGEGGNKEKSLAAKPIDPRISEDSIQSCLDSTILRFTRGLCTVLACMIPIIAIFVLTTVQDLYHRLGMIAGFALAFSTTLMVLTEATRVHVFTATSAFLAVLVVFIPVQQGQVP